MSDQSLPQPSVVVLGTKTADPQEVTLPLPVTRSERKLLLIDGHSLAFRAFFALSRAAEYGNGPAFVTDSGEHTEAVYGFLNTMSKMVREHNPTHLVVSFDVEGPTLRSQEYSDYKGGREQTPEAFHGQVPRIQKILEALGIPVVTKDGYEADDILATLARRGADHDFEVLVFSGDRDAFQMVNEHVTVVYPGRTPSDLKMMDAAAVLEKYKVPPQYYPDLAALTGEQADNLPGVPGVGPGFAAKWIEAYGDVESVIAHADKITGKKGEALRENLDAVRRNRKLNRLETDLELDIDLDDAVLPQPDVDALNTLFDELDFGSGLRGRVLGAFSVESSTVSAVIPTVETIATLQSADELTQWFSAMKDAPVAVRPIRHEDDAAPSGAREVTEFVLVGHQLTTQVPQAIHVNLLAIDQQADQAVTDWLSDEQAPKIVEGFKELWKSCALRGIDFRGVVDDISLSAYLLEPARRHYDLESLLVSYLDIDIPPLPDGISETQQPEPTLDIVVGHSGPKPVTSYEVIQREADLALASLELSNRLRSALEADHQIPLLTEMDLPLARILGQMELIGVAVDRQKIHTLLKDFDAPIQQAWDAAQALVPRDEGQPEVNLGSTKQLQSVLFDTLGLPPTKKIKTGYTTSASALEELLGKIDLDSPGAQFLLALRRWRDMTKLKQIVQGLRAAIEDDGRIHTDYQQTVAATGRLSSTDPNLQNIPVRSEEGRQIRAAFVVGQHPKTEYEALVTADYSQIEMRVMAHLSEDQGLIEAFHQGEDLHRYVGAKVFDVAPQDVTSAMRSKVKAMSYGLVYGLSSYGLSQQLNISVDEARTMRIDYFKRFGGVRDFLQGVVGIARKNGYTETIDGRRRYLPDLTSDNRQLRQAAERMALNAPIQGSAADIIKKAMILVDAQFQQHQLRSRLLMQVHDELVVEAAAGEVDFVCDILRTQMASAVTLSVPLEVNVGIGADWNAAAH